jgi:flavin-dependent dehydrogenase
MNDPPGLWDAIVVGAGPAGAATAARLAERGHRVLVVDRKVFPRPKPCGECISPAALRAIRRLGAGELVMAQPHAVLEGWRIVPASSAPFEGRFPETEFGIAIARERFDSALLAHARRAGAEVRTGVRVVDLLRDGGRVTGVRALEGGRSVELGAAVVVGADGLRSAVSRRAGLVRRTPRLRKIALTAHMRGTRVSGRAGELRVLPWGCVGIADIDAALTNVTIVVGGTEARGIAAGRDAYFDAVVRRTEGLADARRVSEVLSTGPFDWPIRSAIAAGVLLVGDAAGYYDPFTGQGIYRALRGAELASEVLDAAISAGDVSHAALRMYESGRLRAFRPGERLQRVIEAVVSRPRLLALAAARLRRNTALADRLIAVTGDLAPIAALAWGPRR